MSEPDVIEILQALLRFDTTNHGDGVSAGETPCARWIAARLERAGYATTLLHRADAPHRENLVVRVPGTDPALPGLVVQGHTDAVPAEADEWSTDPFGGEIRDGLIYGRGAVDMKDMVASMVWTLLDWARRGARPRRDLVFAFVADEEAAGAWGAEWLVDHHPQLFAGCAAAIGEDGGQVSPVAHADGHTVHLYPVAVAERGTMHCELTASGRPGHASRPSGEDAVTRLLAAVARIAGHEWPRHVPDSVRAQVAATAAALGLDVDVDDPASFAAFCLALGPDAAGPLPWTVRPTATPTVLAAGDAVNVVPSHARARFDVRVPPGTWDATRTTLRELAGPGIDIEFFADGLPTESPIESEWFDAIARTIAEFDPEGHVVPLCLGGGTDAKAFARLGLATYGFTPLGPDPRGRRPGGIHGIDEHNTVAGVRTGARMLERFLVAV